MPRRLTVKQHVLVEKVQQEFHPRVAFRRGGGAAANVLPQARHLDGDGGW